MVLIVNNMLPMIDSRMVPLLNNMVPTINNSMVPTINNMLPKINNSMVSRTNNIVNWPEQVTTVPAVEHLGICRKFWDRLHVWICMSRHMSGHAYMYACICSHTRLFAGRHRCIRGWWSGAGDCLALRGVAPFASLRPAGDRGDSARARREQRKYLCLLMWMGGLTDTSC